MTYIAIAIKKTEYYIVFGKAINNGRGAKTKSNAEHFKEKVFRFCVKGVFAEAFKRNLAFVCWGGGKYPSDCHFGGELSLVKNSSLWAVNILCVP